MKHLQSIGVPPTNLGALTASMINSRFVRGTTGKFTALSGSNAKQKGTESGEASEKDQSVHIFDIPS